jgi:hypothetical protein
MGKVIDRLPEAWKTRKTADAVMSPSAILLAGAGAAAAILLGGPLAVVLGAGALLYGGRVATLMPRRKGKERIDPMSIADPWRGFTREALDAQRRYRKAVSTTQPGPMRERLVEIGDGIDEGVSQCWRIARRGDVLVNAIDNLDSIQARKELDAAKRAAKDTPGEAQKQTVVALQAQVDSADRLIKVAQDAQNDLRLLNARLDEAVARAVELAIRAEDVGELSGLGDDVEALVSQMESMRQGLEEAAGKAEDEVTGAVAAAGSAG